MREKLCNMPTFAHLYFCLGGVIMRVILDTDKKTITVPWNYQKKLKEKHFHGI